MFYITIWILFKSILPLAYLQQCWLRAAQVSHHLIPLRAPSVSSCASPVFPSSLSHPHSLTALSTYLMMKDLQYMYKVSVSRNQMQYSCIGIFKSLKCDVNPQPNTRGIGPLVGRTSRYRRSVMHVLMVILSITCHFSFIYQNIFIQVIWSGIKICPLSGSEYISCILINNENTSSGNYLTLVKTTLLTGQSGMTVVASLPTNPSPDVTANIPIWAWFKKQKFHF